LCRYNKGMFEDLMRRYGFVALLLSLVFLVVFSENGLVDYVKLKGQLKAIDVSTARLHKENLTLKGEIERLTRDDKYLEELARQRYGFIREGEKVYRIER
jgi:cell division protein FtsB